ncbi:AMP-binding protein [Galactobacter caseinivorans]|uniref:AMP-dependent synthetase n=1 Tax=Galactobacter caseinivorans TaxID=2676123 RepID=A0A496PLN5_9MICC|nr:AMP-binding protein [Galactobacter caseinivorans]RKW71354.1 AMP-dependent synthetase [Galactobacter caseinivorans]
MLPGDLLHLPDDASAAFAASVASLASRLGAAQAGSGPAVEVLEGAEPGTFTVTTPTGAGHGTAAVVRTSGSTGTPKRTALPAASLAASAAATRTYLGGDGHWLLALPLHYVAGLAVVSRALLGGTRLATLDLTRHFAPADFAAATESLRHAVGPSERLYTSLVPTQLTRLVQDPDPAVRSALLEYSAILVGGGRAPDATRAAAREAGLAVVLTYGSAETCGGCVYDGAALPGVSVRSVDGRLRLGGPMVAAGYLGDPERTAEHFVTDADAVRWYITDDLGQVSEDGTVSVSGRTDDVINTGGVKVSAQEVQRVIESVDGVQEAFVAGVAHRDWVETVAVALVVRPELRSTGPGPDLGPDADAELVRDIRAAVLTQLGRAAVPTIFSTESELPRLSNGKPDRVRIINRLRSAAGEVPVGQETSQD